MTAIFGKDACPYTQAALDDYKGRGVQVEYFNVKKSARDLDRMLALNGGRRRVPTIVAEDGTVTVGFGGT